MLNKGQDPNRAFVQGKDRLPADMRRRIGGLFSPVKSSMKRDPMLGRIPAFANRRRRHQDCLFEGSHGALRRVALIFSLFGT